MGNNTQSNKPAVAVQTPAKDQAQVSHVVEGKVGPDGALVTTTTQPVVVQQEKVSGSGTKEDPLHSDGVQTTTTTAQVTQQSAVSAEQAAQEMQAKNAQAAQEVHEKIQKMAAEQPSSDQAKEGDVRVIEGTDITYHVGNTDPASAG